MIIRRAAIVAAWLAGFGCQDLPPGAPPPPSAPSHDAAVADRPAPRHDATPGEGLAALVGDWQGEAHTAEYGWVRARLRVDERGDLAYTIVGEGTSARGGLRIEDHDGHTVRLRNPDGQVYALPLVAAGDDLVVTLPVIGDARLRRAPGVEPLPDPAQPGP
jgi:hypothetical protein